MLLALGALCGACAGPLDRSGEDARAEASVGPEGGADVVADAPAADSEGSADAAPSADAAVETGADAAAPAAPYRACGFLGGLQAERVERSPDGSTLAVLGGGALELLRARDGAVLQLLDDAARPAYATAAAFAQDGALLVSGGDDGWIRVWRTSDGALLRSWQAHAQPVASLAVTAASGGLLATSADGDVLRLFRLEDGALARTLAQAVNSHPERAFLAFSPDGSTLASGGDRNSGVVQHWRVRDGALLWTQRLGRAGVLAVAFSPDGTLIASGSQESGGLRLWRASDGTLLRAPTTGEGELRSLAFSPDGSLLAAASSQGVLLYQGSQGSLLRSVPAASPATWVSFDASARELTVAHGTVAPTFHDPATGALSRTLPTEPDASTAVTFSPDGQTLATAGHGAAPGEPLRVRLWDPRRRTLLRELAPRASDLQPRFFLPDGATLVVSSRSSWSTPEDAVQLVNLVDNTAPTELSAGALSRDGALLASQTRADSAGSVALHVERVSDRSVLFEAPLGAPGSQSSALSYAFSPDGRWLAVGVYEERSDRRVALFSLAEGRLAREFSSPGGFAYGLAFAPDSDSLVAGNSSDGEARSWRRSDGALQWTGTPPGETLTFSPDGALLAGGNAPSNVSPAGHVRLRRARDGQPLAALTGHGQTVSAIAFSPDGALLAAVGQGRVRLWCRR